MLADREGVSHLRPVNWLHWLTGSHAHFDANRHFRRLANRASDAP